MKYEIYFISYHCQPIIKLLKDIETFHESEAGQIEDDALEVRITFGLSGLLSYGWWPQRWFQGYLIPCPSLNLAAMLLFGEKQTR
jgi:hypothetical protein